MSEEPTLQQKSRHLDLLMHRRVQRVHITNHGSYWQVWDADPFQTQPFGPSYGFPTKTAALLWIRQWNAEDFMKKLVVSA